mmetsp:Transcript_17907/g.33134  ORF Transcript_17907/g.33134 Transcript_17907/m.33134 type:complete len:373 (+) Transcript_17907:64-1182(+)
MSQVRCIYAVTVALIFIRSCLGCTYFEIRTKGVPTVIGNTNEWITPDSAKTWQVAVQPRGEKFNPSCKGGRSWQAKLGFVAMTTGGYYNDTGGNSMNEAGLAISEHALRGVGTYRPGNSTQTLCAQDLATWLMTTFETVAELREVLPSVAVLSDGPGTNSDPGSQWAIADAKGESIVVDHVAGSLHIYDNRAVGVLTNDPDYPWQVRNLNNYVGLSMGWPTGNEGIAVDSEFGTVPVAVGHGQNMLGLPGDLSPPARFVRTFFTRSYALRATPPKHLEDSLVIASGLLNTQHILKGFNARLHTEHGYDYTQFGVMKVPAEKLFYYRTYEASQWRLVNLSAVDFGKSGHSKPSGGFAAIDVTSELQPPGIMNV